MDDATIGHNAPPRIDLAAALESSALRAWLEYEFTHHAARAYDLTAGFLRFETATEAGIVSEALAGKTTDLIRMLKAEIKALDTTRTRIKDPVLKAGREIDGYAKQYADPLSGQARIAESRLAAYYAVKEKAEREAREQAAREAEERAAALAAEGATEEAHEAFEEAGKAIEAAQAGAADLTRVHTHTGGVSSLKVSWDFEILNIFEVPRRFLQVAESLVKIAIREAPRAADGSPKLDIPGIRIYRVNAVTVR
jgi:hypothetical protein